MTLTLILLAIGFTLLFLAVRSLRSNRLNERYALVFVFVGLPFFGLAAWPDAVGWFAAWLGIEYQTILLLTVTTFFLLMNFKLLSIVSRQERRIGDLAQIVAILKQQQRDGAMHLREVTREPLPWTHQDEAESPRTLKRGA